MLLLSPSIRDLLVLRILGIAFFIKEHGHFWIFNFGTWGILHIHSHFCLHGLGEYLSGWGLQSPGVSPHPSLPGTSAFSLLEDYSFIKTTRRIVFLSLFFPLLFQTHWWTVHVARALKSQDPWKMGNSLEKPNALAMPLSRGLSKSQTQRVGMENREAEQIMNDSGQERESGLGVLGGEGLKLRVTKLSGTSDEILKGECTEETHVQKELPFAPGYCPSSKQSWARVRQNRSDWEIPQK